MTPYILFLVICVQRRSILTCREETPGYEKLWFEVLLYPFLFTGKGPNNQGGAEFEQSFQSSYLAISLLSTLILDKIQILPKGIAIFVFPSSPSTVFLVREYIHFLE